MTKTVLDHVAIGTNELTDGWELFGGVLGGSWVYGGDATGFWWGQLEFGAGPKIELITPTGGPDSAFLERFLDSRGPGVHHLNFVVSDIHATLSRVRALGIEPVGVSLLSATWKEAFLHPKDAHGIVVQVAEQSGPPPELDPPAELGQPGPASAFAVVEHHVADLEECDPAICGSARRLDRQPRRQRRCCDGRADLAERRAPAARAGRPGV